jgi:acid phosphatase
MKSLAKLCSLHIIGDWGRRGQFFQRDIADKMNNIPHDAIISVGDNFYPDGIQSPIDQQIKESWTDIYNPEKPWYVALGNHDYHGNVTAQIEIQHPYWNMPTNQYEFTICNHSFVVIDSTVMDNEKWNYVDYLLQKTPSTYKWIVAHHPIYSGGWHHNVDHEYRQNISDLVYNHKVLGVLSGHDHNLQYIEWDGVRQIISGAGSSAYHATSPQEGVEFFKAAAGFVNMAIYQDRVQILFIDVDKVLFEKTIYYPYLK